MSAFLDAVQARLGAATPGPWKPYRTGKWEHDNYVVREDLAGIAMQYALVWQPGDAEFIAHSKEDLAALLAFAREVAAVMDRYEDWFIDGPEDSWRLQRDITAARNRLEEES